MGTSGAARCTILHWGLLDGWTPQQQPTSHKAPSAAAATTDPSIVVRDGWRFCICHAAGGSTLYAWGALAESVGTEWSSPDDQPFTAVTAGWDELWAATPNSLYCLKLTSREPSSRATAEPSSRATAEPAQSCVRLSLPVVLKGAADARVLLLAAGTKHVVAVTCGGQCFSWGDGALGQLGHGGREHVSTPRHLPLSDAPSTRVTALACGSLHTLLLGSDDVVYACGHSLYGQCGLGSAEDALRPTPVVGLAQLGCRQLAAGLAHSLATTQSGDLYTWGWNHEGQLGTGDAASAMLPQLVETPALDGTVLSISAGARHSVALTNDGSGRRTLYAWGCNRWAQLGMGMGSNCKVPSRVEVIADHWIVQGVSCGWWHTSAVVLHDPRG